MNRALPISAVAAALLALTPQPGEARYEGPWCAHRSLGMGFYENKCDINTYEACRAEIFSMPGAYCTQNPWYVPPQPGKARKKARRPQS